MTDLTHGALAPARPAPRRTPSRVRSLPVAWVGPALLLVAALVGGAVASGQDTLVAVAAVVGIVALAVAMALWPDVATVTVLVLIYTNAPVVGAQFHALPYFVAAVFPALLIIPLIDHIVIKREGLVLPPTVPFVLAFLLVEVVSTLLSRDPALAAVELGRVVSEGVIIYLLVVNTVRTMPVLRASIIALVAAGAVLAAMTVMQQLTGFGNTFLGFAQVQGGFAIDITGAIVQIQPRAAGPIGEKNFYAQMLLALIPLVFILVRTGRPPMKIAASVAGGLIAVAVALTFSRGAALAAVLLVPAMLVLGIIGWRGVVAAVAVAALVLVSVPNYAQRLTSLEAIGGALTPSTTVDPVLSQRANDVLAAAVAFLDHPIVGVGPGLFPTYYQAYARQVAGLPGTLDYAAHSLYAEVASETGFLGLLAFGGLIVTTLVLLVRARRLAAGRHDLIAVAEGFILVVVVYLATGLALHISYQRYIWMFLALSAAAAVVVRREVEPRAQPIDERAAGRRRPLRYRRALDRLAAPRPSQQTSPR